MRTLQTPDPSNVIKVRGLRTAFVALLLSIGSFEATAAAAANAPLRVLFIGNSYTYVNNLPSLLSSLATVSGHAPAIEAAQVAQPAATLETLWNEGDARNAIRSHHWDFVVLQEQSVRPIMDPASMFAAVREFNTEIHAGGAKTVLFLTWARRDAPDTQATLNHAYGLIGHELGAVIAPVGPVWQRAQTVDSQLSLYQDDGSHPTIEGSYLAACVFYSTLVYQAGNCPQPELMGVSKFDEQAITAIEAQMRNWHPDNR